MLHRYTGLKDIYCCFSQAPPLTVIVGAKCSDGIALVADRKLTNIFDESVRYDNKVLVIYRILPWDIQVQKKYLIFSVNML